MRICQHIRKFGTVEFDYFSAVSIKNEEPFFCVVALRSVRVMTSSLTRFLEHTQRRTTVGRNILEE
jgi:hypothetical protein